MRKTASHILILVSSLSIFDTANTAAAVAGIVWFFSYVPYFFLQPRYSQLSQGAKIAACLLSNTAMSMGTLVIGMFEGTGMLCVCIDIERKNIAVASHFVFPPWGEIWG